MNAKNYQIDRTEIDKVLDHLACIKSVASPLMNKIDNILNLLSDFEESTGQLVHDLAEEGLSEVGQLTLTRVLIRALNRSIENYQDRIKF